MAYNTIVFDWDGTLMDSTWSIAVAIQGACRDLGVPEPTMQEAKWVIGLGMSEVIPKIAPNLSQPQLQEFLQAYRRHYFTQDQDLKLFNGIPQLLQQLKQQGLNLAVATGKSRVGLNRALDKHQLTPLFDITRTADETRGKPHPQMLFEIIDELMVEPEQVVMIGDTSHDIQMAQNAGVDSIAVTYGAHEIEELDKAQPSKTAASVEELARLLELFTVH
ncbi:HAD-IA family hydrolase [Brackiella oedipodis]|uniref:HAD-IA family hydrolase n=1 Tax=Brackiella oedipodis TaxID=124225 RepID=UPI00048BD156|nr:HAD-IA family hydrolase [Brackiella oedipodis]